MKEKLRIGAIVRAVRITDNGETTKYLKIVSFDPHHMTVGIDGLKGRFSVRLMISGKWSFIKGNTQYIEL